MLPIVASLACLHWETDFNGLNLHVGAFPHKDEWNKHICTWGTWEPAVSLWYCPWLKQYLAQWDTWVAGWTGRHCGQANRPLGGFGSQDWTDRAGYLVLEGGTDGCPLSCALCSATRIGPREDITFGYCFLPASIFLVFFMIESPVHHCWFVTPPKSHPQKHPKIYLKHNPNRRA